MRLRISHLIIALVALLIGFLLGLPHARAETMEGIVGRRTVDIGVPINPPMFLLAYRRS